MERNNRIGMRARDRITGFEGTVTSYVQSITGCDRYALTPRSADATKTPETGWFDEHQLEFLEGEKLVLDAPPEARNKGAMGDPPPRGAR